MGIISSWLGKPVVVRSSESGVWMGYLQAKEGNSVLLSAARRAWKWEGATECAGLANDGPANGKITVPVEILVLGCCEVIEMSGKALDRWNSVTSWVTDEKE